MPRLTHQNRQSHYAQIGSLALGVTSARKLSRCRGGDVSVEVGRIERQQIRRQLEPCGGSAGNLNLRRLQVLIRNLRCQPVECLPGKCGRR